MSVAVVAILAISAPQAHICCSVFSSAASVGVSSKLWDDRMTFVSTGTGPPPARVRLGQSLRAKASKGEMNRWEMNRWGMKILLKVTTAGPASQLASRW